MHNSATLFGTSKPCLHKESSSPPGKQPRLVTQGNHGVWIQSIAPRTAARHCFGDYNAVTHSSNVWQWWCHFQLCISSHIGGHLRLLPELLP